MKLLKFMLKACRGIAVVTMITALASGACNIGLVALINEVIDSPSKATGMMALLFGLLLAGKVLTNMGSQIGQIKFTQNAVANLRQSMVRKILSVPLRRLEEVGGPRIWVALTDDIAQISNALFSFPILSVNLAILVAGSAYMAWLSWPVLLVMGLFVLIAAALYRLVVVSGFQSLQKVRESEDRLYGHFRALVDGIKELKLHRDRRREFFHEDLRKTTEEFQNHTVRAEIRFVITHSWAHLLFFVLIGLLLFLLPQVDQVSKKTMTGFILTTLYLMGPLAGVLANLPILGRANVALSKIDELGLSLGDAGGDLLAPGPRTPPAEFKTLELRGVTHTYYVEHQEEHFTLGPIHLTFEPGELVFLVGGNGSGKSTLAKMITGLYPPEKGSIWLDGREVNEQNVDEYRQLFSTVFSDYYLFDRLMGVGDDQVDEKASEYLEQLHLRRKVQIRDRKLSTTALSAGQRKRLALLTCYLEDRSFYVFDEWASDQDPHFKRIFYEQILPDLKARGKTALVITHDDRYFHLADTLLKLDYGKLVSSELVRDAGLKAEVGSRKSEV